MEEPLSCLFQEANPARLHESLNLKVISSSSKSELTLAVCCIRKYSRFSFVQEGEKLIQNHRENQPFEFHYEFSITLIHGRPSWLEELVNWIPLGKEGRKEKRKLVQWEYWWVQYGWVPFQAFWSAFWSALSQADTPTFSTIHSI